MPKPIKITDITLSGGEVRTHNYIDALYAMAGVTKHLQRAPMNTVRIEGRMCYTLHQAERAIREHFQETERV